MKRFLSILLALTAVIFSSFPSFAAKSVKFTASDCEVFAGDEFTVDIFISDYSLLKSATILVEYDKKSMQFLDLNIGAIVTAGSKAVSFKDVKNSDRSYVQIDYNDSTASLSTAGKFLSLIFVANDSAVGETAVKLSVNGNKITVSSGSLTPEFKNSKIKIINNNPVVDSKPEMSSEDVSSSAPESSENAENTQNTAAKPSESLSQNANSNDKTPDKSESKKNSGLAVAAVVITVIVICAVLFGSNGSKGTKSRKKKRKKRRKSRK